MESLPYSAVSGKQQGQVNGIALVWTQEWPYESKMTAETGSTVRIADYQHSIPSSDHDG